MAEKWRQSDAGLPALSAAAPFSRRLSPNLTYDYSNRVVRRCSSQNALLVNRVWTCRYVIYLISCRHAAFRAFALVHVVMHMRRGAGARALLDGCAVGDPGDWLRRQRGAHAALLFAAAGALHGRRPALARGGQHMSCNLLQPSWGSN